MVNRIWPTAVTGKADSVSSVSASACHIGGPNSVNPGQILLVHGTKGERIYHDQIGDLMLWRPNGRPDGPRQPDWWPDFHRDQIVEIRLSIRSRPKYLVACYKVCFSSYFLHPLIICPNGTTAFRMAVIWSPIRSPGAICSPGAIWSPRSHLVAH